MGAFFCLYLRGNSREMTGNAIKFQIWTGIITVYGLADYFIWKLSSPSVCSTFVSGLSDVLPNRTPYVPRTGKVGTLLYILLIVGFFCYRGCDWWFASRESQSWWGNHSVWETSLNPSGLKTRARWGQTVLHMYTRDSNGVLVMVQSVYSKYTNDGTIFQYVRQKYQSHAALVQQMKCLKYKHISLLLKSLKAPAFIWCFM